jgi:F-type H+/Na+-transporting ATPase subunit beta
VKAILQRYKDLQDIIAILGIDELERRRQADGGAGAQDPAFLSQPFHVAEQFTGFKGKYVKLADTIKGFREIARGQARRDSGAGVLHAGHIEDVLEKSEALKKA